jgi:hypothetical protein
MILAHHRQINHTLYTKHIIDSAHINFMENEFVGNLNFLSINLNAAVRSDQDRTICAVQIATGQENNIIGQRVINLRLL